MAKIWKQVKDTTLWLSDEGEAEDRKYDPPRKVGGISRHKQKIEGIRVYVNGVQHPLGKVMWETFNGPIPEGYHVRHKNGAKTMNDIYNLELVHASKNSDKAVKAIRKKVKDTYTGKVYMSLEECANATCYDPSSVSKMIKRGKRFKLIERGKDVD